MYWKTSAWKIKKELDGNFKMDLREVGCEVYRPVNSDKL
jgi:hypothetical protein